LFKKITIFITCVFVSLVLFGCSDNKPSNTVTVNTSVTAADGLNLKAVGSLLKTTTTAEELEKKLNEPDGINNLDLDEDGTVDYIKVTEYGNDTAKGFSLTVDLAAGETQEIATIDVVKNGNTADVQVSGNQNIYGNNAAYNSSFSLSDALLFAYLFSPHPIYYSPYHYGYYPTYYRPYRPISVSTYRTRTTKIVKTTPFKKGKSKTVSKKRATSPNKNKIAKNIKAPLKKPTKSQKAFQKRNKSKTVKSGGFGKKKKSSTVNNKKKTSKTRKKYKSKRRASSKSRRFSTRTKSRSSFGGGFRSRRRR